MERIGWLLKMVYKSLARRKSRTFLVVISLTLASALVTVFFSFTTGARLGLGKELRAYGANVIVSPLTKKTGSAGLSLGQISDSGFFDSEELEKYLERQPEVKEAKFQLLVKAYYQKQPLTFLGMEKKAFQGASRFWKIEGRLPLRGKEALVGSQLAKKFSWEIGKQLNFELEKKKFNLKVVGIAESGVFEDETLMLNQESLAFLMGAKGKASQVLLRVEPAAKISFFEKKLEESFPSLEVRTLQQVVKREKNIVSKVEKLLFLAAVFVLIATSISVANTTSVTVVERWREIGLLKALGGSNWFVLGFFLLEASASAFLAGAIGLLLGWFLTEVFAFSVFSVLVPFIWWSMPASFFVCLLINFTSSIWPLRLIFQIEPALVLKGQ